MPLKLVDVVDIIRENHRRSGNPVGVSPKQCSSWAEDLGLPRGGDTILYTSCMYQSIPYIIELTKMLEKIEAAPGFILSIGGMIARAFNVPEALTRSRVNIDRYNSIVRRIALALRRQGVGLGYLYEDEPYSGALFYELGLEEDFRKQAQVVVSIFRERGVRRVVVVDPHTYYVLSRIYPKYIDGYNIEVIHYLEILDPGALRSSGVGEAVIHDPCLLARFMRITEPQRRILRALGFDLKEPKRSGVRTRCCGGPIEALSPRLSRRIGESRVEELLSHSERIVVLCPICFSNISRLSEEYGAEVIDIAETIEPG
jgi:Fe-S oxidoreductase